MLAVALTAGMRAVAQSADAATLLKQRTLALWVAQNRLAAAQLELPWPAPGEPSAASGAPTLAPLSASNSCTLRL